MKRQLTLPHDRDPSDLQPLLTFGQQQEDFQQQEEFRHPTAQTAVPTTPVRRHLSPQQLGYNPLHPQQARRHQTMRYHPFQRLPPLATVTPRNHSHSQNLNQNLGANLLRQSAHNDRERLEAQARTKLQAMRARYHMQIKLVFDELQEINRQSNSRLTSEAERRKLCHAIETMDMLLRLLEREPSRITTRNLRSLEVVETQIIRRVLPLYVLIRSFVGNKPLMHHCLRLALT